MTPEQSKAAGDRVVRISYHRRMYGLGEVSLSLSTATTYPLRRTALQFFAKGAIIGGQDRKASVYQGDPVALYYRGSSCDLSPRHVTPQTALIGRSRTEHAHMHIWESAGVIISITSHCNTSGDQRCLVSLHGMGTVRSPCSATDRSSQFLRGCPTKYPPSPSC